MLLLATDVHLALSCAVHVDKIFVWRTAAQCNLGHNRRHHGHVNSIAPCQSRGLKSFCWLRLTRTFSCLLPSPPPPSSVFFSCLSSVAAVSRHLDCLPGARILAYANIHGSSRFGQALGSARRDLGTVPSSACPDGCSVRAVCTVFWYLSLSVSLLNMPQ